MINRRPPLPPRPNAPFEFNYADLEACLDVPVGGRVTRAICCMGQGLEHEIGGCQGRPEGWRGRATDGWGHARRPRRVECARKNDFVRARSARRRTVTRASATRKPLTRVNQWALRDSNPRPQPCESVLGGFRHLGIPEKTQLRGHLRLPLVRADIPCFPLVRARSAHAGTVISDVSSGQSDGLLS
jgi:hypothetical protein